MKKSIEAVVKAVVWLTFCAPMVVVPSSFIFPFIVPKILIFRSLVEIALGGYFLLLLINWQEYKPKLTALNLAVLAFWLSFAISTFVGVDPYHSFWDNHERMLGLFTVSHYFAYYFICSGIFKSWGDWKWALRLFLVAGSVVMFVGLLQTQNPELLLNQGSDRVASTLGNSIYVGGYGLFLIFAAYLLAMREKNKVWCWVEYIIGAMGFLGMLASGTRGSVLGFVAGFGAAVVGYIIVLKKHPRLRKSLAALLLLGVISTVLLVSFRKTDFVRNLPAVGRTVNTSLSDVMASPRWIAWSIAVQSWRERPFFGWGPNNFFYAFNEHYNPRSLNFGYGETWFDNAHNIIVNTLAVQGAFGVLTYLAVFIVGIISLYKIWRHDQINLHVVVIGSAFLVAHLVGNITVFENPTSYLYFMFWLAMVNRLSMYEKPVILPAGQTNNKSVEQANKKMAVDRPVSTALVGVVGGFVLVLIFIFNIQPARANMMTLDAIRAISSDPLLAVPAMRSALQFNSPHVDDIRSDIGRSTAQTLSSYWQKLGKDRSNELLQLTYEELKKNLVLHPLDIRNQLTLAQMAQLGATINNSAQYIYDAEGFLKDALVKSPRRQQIMYSLAGLEVQINKGAEATKLLQSAIDDNPAVPESYWRLAYTYKVLGQDKEAQATLDLANKNGIVFGEQEQGIIKQILTPVATTTAKKK